jgi:hypothetical protein
MKNRSKKFLLSIYIFYASFGYSVEHIMPRADHAVLAPSEYRGDIKNFSGDFDGDGDNDTIELNSSCNLTIKMNQTIQVIEGNDEDCSDTFVYIKPTVMIHVGNYGTDYGNASIYEYDKKLKNWFYVGHMELSSAENGLKNHEESISKLQKSLDGKMTRKPPKRGKAFWY